MANSTQRCRKCKQRKKTEEMKKQGLSYVCIKCDPVTGSKITGEESTQTKGCAENSEQGAGLTRSLKRGTSNQGKARQSNRKAKRKSLSVRKSACGEKCTLRVSPNCQDGETVVLCHLNTPFKGTALKSPDLFAVYGCYSCHFEYLDRGLVGKADQLRALFESQMIMLEKGLLVMK